MKSRKKSKKNVSQIWFPGFYYLLGFQHQRNKKIFIRSPLPAGRFYLSYNLQFFQSLKGRKRGNFELRKEAKEIYLKRDKSRGRSLLSKAEGMETKGSAFARSKVHYLG